MNNNELMHFGVKGMKWGVRKAHKKASKSDDAKEYSSIRKKKVSQMSNTELRKANDRANLEQNYRRLHPNAIKKGMRYVATTAGVMSTALNLYNNSDKIVSLGKKLGNKVVDSVGDLLVKELKKGFSR